MIEKVSYFRLCIMYENPLFSLGKPQKSNILGKPQESNTYVKDLSSYGRKTMFLVPFFSKKINLVCKCYFFVVSSKCYFFVVSPREIKGFSGQPVTAAGIFWGDYGYPVGNLNCQTHFKIGDSSL